ncbi:hypothetical protein H4R34_003640 [Dimargaris verticillata]|uniref:Hcy-binding domain-containing protein n=1 Tax=Dimargaris verticillata TaxID=2761393 RepID=A0A9W8B5U5_9FUNG|nr:hypothetical protein H4R34_003640 [Dimargaris verticillata]
MGATHVERPHILDGALGTYLESHHGQTLNDSPLWSAHLLTTDPQLLQRVHTEYLDAGADIITTATYQASAEGFRQIGVSDPTAIRHHFCQAIQLAVDSCEEYVQRHPEAFALASPTHLASAGNRPLPQVAISLGSYGAVVGQGAEYTGDFGQGCSVETLRAFHRDRLVLVRDILDKNHSTAWARTVKWLALETVPCLMELTALVLALEDAWAADKDGKGLPAVWVTMACSATGNLKHGEPLSACVPILANCPWIAAIGVNCTYPEPGAMDYLIDTFRAHTNKPLVCYPNAQQWNTTTNAWHQQSYIFPNTFGEMAMQWHQRGATIMGGCCRTSPAHILAIAQRLRPQPH